MKKGAILQYYTIEIRYRDGTKEQVRITASKDKTAITKLAGIIKDKPVASFLMFEPIPKSKYELEKQINYKKAQRERRKKEYESTIATYIGTERIK